MSLSEDIFCLDAEKNPRKIKYSNTTHFAFFPFISFKSGDFSATKEEGLFVLFIFIFIHFQFYAFGFLLGSFGLVLSVLIFMQCLSSSGTFLCYRGFLAPPYGRYLNLWLSNAMVIRFEFWRFHLVCWWIELHHSCNGFCRNIFGFQNFVYIVVAFWFCCYCIWSILEKF